MSLTLTLHFTSEEQKRAFLGQFSDGWGENCVTYKRTGDDLHIIGVYDPSNHYSTSDWIPSIEPEEDF
jgi:hypothetical protein